MVVSRQRPSALVNSANQFIAAMGATLWKETIYNVGSWGQSLRGLVNFRNQTTIRHDNMTLELTAAASTAVSSVRTNGSSLLFTVCLDHRMRIWDVHSGQILYAGDILNIPREENEYSRWTIEPSQSNLIRVLHDVVEGQCLIVTFSPIGAGQFKFWTFQLNEQGSAKVNDCFPAEELKPPSPSADVWTMADFAIRDKGDGIDLWVLWKNNITYRTQQVKIQPRGEDRGLGRAWQGWNAVQIDIVSPTLEASSSCDPMDATEKWLDAILQPGRFSRSTIEAALTMYEKGLGSGKGGASKGSGKSLAESICTVLGSTATLNRNTAGGMDYEQFRGTSETQWLRLWRLLLELDKLGGEALSLVVDNTAGSTWVVCAGCMAAVRECSSMERVFYNLQAPEKSSASVAALVSAGLRFTECFTDSMLQLTRGALQFELFEDSGKPSADRMQEFADKAGFWRQLTEEDCAPVIETLGQSFRVVTRKLYADLFDLIETSESPEPSCPLTELGRNLVVRAVQETSVLHQQVLFSQLVLLVHMEFEIDNEEDSLHSRFDVGLIYRKLLSALRRLEHIKWLTKTEMTITATRTERSGSFSANASFSSSLSISSSPSIMRRGLEETRVLTPLEGMLGHLWGVADIQNQDFESNLTDIAVGLCAPSSGTELMPYLQQCWFLKLDRPDLALELSPFSDQEPFPTYIQGRVFLALQDFDTAAVSFRKASVGLSFSAMLARHSSGLLDDTEWNLLGSGLPNYYWHIASLFERHRTYSFVMEFARLGLQFALATGSKASATRTELLSRLFHAATAISHFDVAHSTLLAMDNGALQKSCLRELIERMCEKGQNVELVSLPFSGLQNRVDEILADKCRNTRDVLHHIPYHQILYAWRISHNDYRGGAAILLDRLEKLRALGEGDKFATDDVMDTQVTRQYLLLINALSCVPAEEAYILQDVPVADEKRREAGSEGDLDVLDVLDSVVPDGDGTQSEDEDQDLARKIAKFEKDQRKDNTPRRLLTLADLRKDYELELDRVVAIHTNQFGFTGDQDETMDMTA